MALFFSDSSLPGWLSLWWFDNHTNQRDILISGIVSWTGFLSDMLELCLMASHGYPSALVLHHQQHPSREIKVPYKLIDFRNLKIMDCVFYYNHPQYWLVSILITLDIVLEFRISLLFYLIHHLGHGDLFKVLGVILDLNLHFCDYIRIVSLYCRYAELDRKLLSGQYCEVFILNRVINYGNLSLGCQSPIN